MNGQAGCWRADDEQGASAWRCPGHRRGQVWFAAFRVIGAERKSQGACADGLLTPQRGQVDCSGLQWTHSRQFAPGQSGPERRNLPQCATCRRCNSRTPAPKSSSPQLLHCTTNCAGTTSPPIAPCSLLIDGCPSAALPLLVHPPRLAADHQARFVPTGLTDPMRLTPLSSAPSPARLLLPLLG